MPSPNLQAALIGAKIEDIIAEDFRRREAEASDARRYNILKVATPTQFRQIWDRMVQGEKFDALVDELGKVQAEQGKAGKGRAA